MKKTIILTLVTLITLSLNAQSLLPKKYGVKIGANIANIHSEPNTGVENIESSPLIGVSGGFYMEIPLNDKWYINPELIYTQKGGSFTYNYQHNYQVNERDLHKTNHELKLTYIELNPTVSYKTNEKISLNFGPSISYLFQPVYTILSDKGENENDPLHEELPDGEYKEETLDIGVNIAISYYLTEKFLIEAKVNTGFMNTGEVSKIIYTENNGNDTRSSIYTIKNRTIVFSLGYLF